MKLNRPVNSTYVRDLLVSARPEGPKEVTQLVVRLAAVLLGAAIALAGEPIFGLLLGGGLLGALTAARRWRIHRMTTSLYSYLTDLLKAEEAAGDRAQDRRMFLRLLRGDWKAPFTTTGWEDVRARVRASSYIRIEVLGGGVLPTQDDVTRVRVSWAPKLQINKPGIRSDILAQVTAWYGVDCEPEGGIKKGFDTRHRYVWIRPKVDADLPDRAPYPGTDAAWLDQVDFTQDLPEVDP